jgi:hypothetical protein
LTIEILHRFAIQGDLHDAVVGGEVPFKHGAGAEVTEFGADEGLPLGMSRMVCVNNGVQLTVNLDDHAGTEVVAGNHRCSLRPSDAGSAKIVCNVNGSLKGSLSPNTAAAPLEPHEFYQVQVR